MSNEIEFGMDLGEPGGDHGALAVMEFGQIERFRIIVSPEHEPAYQDITCKVSDYLIRPPPPAPEILELLQHAQRQIEEECGIPRDSLLMWPRRAGKATYLEQMRDAILRTAVEGMALLPTPPILIEYPELTPFFTDLEEPGEREMDAVRAVCRGL